MNMPLFSANSAAYRWLYLGHLTIREESIGEALQADKRMPIIVLQPTGRPSVLKAVLLKTIRRAPSSLRGVDA